MENIMGHHISGMSNSAKRRAAVAEVHHPEESAGLFHSRFDGLYAMGKEKAVELEHAVEETIQHRPIVSVLSALGIGLVLGVVSTMACNCKRN
jgi:hypothetical protein